MVLRIIRICNRICTLIYLTRKRNRCKRETNHEAAVSRCLRDSRCWKLLGKCSC